MAMHFLVLLLMLVTAGPAVAGHLINACVKKATGAVRIVTEYDACTAAETALSWPSGEPGGGGLPPIVGTDPANGGVDSEPTKGVFVECPTGTFATGGGVRVYGDFTNVAVTSSGPELDDDGRAIGWYGFASENELGNPGDWGLRVDLFCSG